MIWRLKSSKSVANQSHCLSRQMQGIKNTIGGGVLNGRAEKLAVPPYPAAARSAHASGYVQVLVLN